MEKMEKNEKQNMGSDLTFTWMSCNTNHWQLDTWTLSKMYGILGQCLPPTALQAG